MLADLLAASSIGSCFHRVWSGGCGSWSQFALVFAEISEGRAVGCLQLCSSRGRAAQNCLVRDTPAPPW